MGIEQRLGLRPWQWGLRARLMWALAFFRGDAAELAKLVEHIAQSDLVRSTDLAGAHMARDRYDALSIAADRTRAVAGIAMEFGVFEGITLRHLAKEIGPDRKIVGFDTFQGLPTDWGDLLGKGTFATKVPTFDDYPNVGLEVGRIEEKLPAFIGNAKPSIALVHIDCPYYEINMFILEHVLPLMPPGSVVVFDEYYGYPSFEPHEFRAWADTRKRFNLQVAALAYSSRSAAFELVHNPRFTR